MLSASSCNDASLNVLRWLFALGCTVVISRSVSAVAVASGVLNTACCGASSVTVGTVAISGTAVAASGVSVTSVAVGMFCDVSNFIGFGMIAKAVTFTAVSFSDFCTLFFCTFLFVFSKYSINSLV